MTSSRADSPATAGRRQRAARRGSAPRRRSRAARGPRDAGDGDRSRTGDVVPVDGRGDDQASARRHAARTQGSASAGGNPGTRWPTTRVRVVRRRETSVAARLGAVGELVPCAWPCPRGRSTGWATGSRPRIFRAPAAMGAGDDGVSRRRPRARSRKGRRRGTPKRDDPRRRKVQLPGCTDAPIPWRASLDAALRPFCKAHRTRAQSIRCVRKLGGAEAVVLLAGGLKQRDAV